MASRKKIQDDYKALFLDSRRRLRQLHKPPVMLVLVGFFILFYFGLLCFTDQLGHFWATQEAWERKSVLIKLDSHSPNFVSIESSTGFNGRWERGADASDTIRRLSAHLNKVILQNQLIVGLMKKEDLSSTKVLIKLGPLVNYGDFKPILSALQNARVDHYGML